MWGYAPYVPIAEKHRKAKKKMEKLAKQGMKIHPVTIEGRKISHTFWGKSWCDHIELFNDYESRLPRGRTYVRNGSVCHLAIEQGKITAMVAGSTIYEINITIKALASRKWQQIKKSCRGQVNSLFDLLSGRLSKTAMAKICCEREGLFPLENEIKLNCSCPDWAVMCKHVAAVLYGIGSRLDTEPALLFALRGVNMEELISVKQTIADITNKGAQANRLQTDDLSSLFDIELDSAKPKLSKDKSKTKLTVKRSRQKSLKLPRAMTGFALRKRRIELGLTKSAVAKKLNVSQTSIANWEAYGHKKILLRETSKIKLQKLWLNIGK